MKRNLKMGMTACAMAGVMMVGGIMAYFTDGDTATNEFTVGKISIDLKEETWNPEDGKDLTPLKEVVKAPKISNDGVNDAYVFMEVIVPYAEVVTANQDGSRNAKAWTELFSYDVKAGWIELEDYKVVDEAAGTVKHLYAYATTDEMTAVGKDVTTESIFDFVRFANLVEDEGLEETDLEIVINSYAIQTQNINDGKTALDGDNADGKVAPSAVWDVLATQSPSVESPVTEDAITDVKQ